MRLVCLAVFISVLMISPAVSACISITEIHPNPEDAKNEWLEIHNNCNMSINLSDIKINDSSSFSKQLNGLTTDTFVIVANKQDLFEGVFGTLNSTVINLSYGSPWMNNDGDTVYMFNGTTLLDIMTYTSSVVGNSWSLCNGTWIETENATPGYPNDCLFHEGSEDENTTESTNESSNVTEIPDYSGIGIETEGTVEQARFGDFSIVSAVLSTGQSKVKLRIAAYIYSPRWASIDLNGDILRTNINESNMVHILETRGENETYILKLPLLLRKNCDNDYDYGVYTGYVKVYEWDSITPVADDKFNISLNGVNSVFCTECDCPDCNCKEKTCTCGTGDSVTMDGVQELFELTGFPEDAYAGEPFNVKVRLENTGIYEREYIVYSYAYQGSRCLTYGLGEDGWKKTWTANQRIMEVPEHSSKEIILESLFPDDTLPGIYTYRIRLKYNGKEYDITRALKLKEPPPSVILNATENVSMESAEEPESVPSAAITGMAAGTEDNLNPVKTIYDSFIEWLSSLFKF